MTSLPNRAESPGSTVRIAVDAMGTDSHPGYEVRAAMQALDLRDMHITLVGDEKKIRAYLAKGLADEKRLSILHADEVVEMHDPPAASVRRKKNSSMNVAVRLLKDGKVDAVLSAGNTGAMVCSTSLNLGLLPGVERPGIGVPIPTRRGWSLLIDVGSNIDVKPIHLLQYAVMGAEYWKLINNVPNPAIGLLNVGEEESKGTELLRGVHALLDRSHLNFTGNLDGKDLYHGNCDVVVCDGFTGNVALKVSESLASTFGYFLKRELGRTPLRRLGALLAAGAFKDIKEQTDYAEKGGAPLLGVNGTVMICHGGSPVKAVRNAIAGVHDLVSNRLNEKIAKVITEEMRFLSEG
ncbi:MAG: phosphate acyltransferase PlsX [Candidatus Omnitrophica bacterium]|nr:phosphate acyltransferase PlsX [Candidatus Omnitrophota bacterium]